MPHTFTRCVRFLLGILARSAQRRGIDRIGCSGADSGEETRRLRLGNGTEPGCLASSDTAQDGTKWGRGAESKRRVGPGRDIETVVAYPYLYLNDIVPMRGYLYRVTVIDDRGEPKGVRGHDSVSMEWVEDKDLPPGITFQPGSVRRSVDARGPRQRRNVQQSAIYVPKIEPSKTAPSPT